MLIHLFVVYMYILRSRGHSAAGDLQFQLVIVMETLLVSHQSPGKGRSLTVDLRWVKRGMRTSCVRDDLRPIMAHAVTNRQLSLWWALLQTITRQRFL